MKTSNPTVLAEIARLLDAGDIEVQSTFYLELESGVQVTVSLEESEDSQESILFFAEIGDLRDDAALLREMASANFLGGGTGDAILALRPDVPRVCLFKRITRAGRSPQDFLPLLDEFCRVATRWQRHLDDRSWIN